MTSISKRISKHVLIDDSPIVIDLHKSQGSWLVDINGRHYLDCFSQFGSQAISWNHPKLLEHKDWLGEIALHKIANSDMLTEVYADFVDAFAGITPDFKHHFYVEGGALAVENALKASFDYCCKSKNISEDDIDVIHFKECFHGRSGYTLSMTDSHCQAKTALFPKFKWTRVLNPKITPNIDIKALENESLDQIRAALNKGNVAAIVLETIQSEGGDNSFRKEFLSELRVLANAFNCMLIFDEVQTFALTGKMWCYENFGIVPDMICFAKKLGVGGFCSTTKIDNVPDNVFKVHSRINSTFGGNIVDMARATIIIKIIQEDNLLQNAQVVGDYFLSKLKELDLIHARGRGLMIAFDLNSPQERDDVLHELKQNVLCLPCGEKSIRFRPHLTFSKDDADIAIKYIKSAVQF